MLRQFLRFISIFIVATAPVFVFAQTPSEKNNSSEAVVSSTQHLTQVFVTLLLVVGLIFALAWLLKKLGNGSLVANSHIKLVANMPLGTRERIALIEVGGKQMLLGITAQQINHLHTFDDAVVDSGKSAENSEFGQKLKDIIAAGGKKS